MSPSDSPDHPGSILYHSKSSEVPYIFHKPVNGQELFFAVSFSKPVLEVLRGHWIKLIHAGLNSDFSGFQWKNFSTIQRLEIGRQKNVSTVYF